MIHAGVHSFFFFFFFFIYISDGEIFMAGDFEMSINTFVVSLLISVVILFMVLVLALAL